MKVFAWAKEGSPPQLPSSGYFWEVDWDADGGWVTWLSNGRRSEFMDDNCNDQNKIRVTVTTPCGQRTTSPVVTIGDSQVCSEKTKHLPSCDLLNDDDYTCVDK